MATGLRRPTAHLRRRIASVTASALLALAACSELEAAREADETPTAEVGAGDIVEVPDVREPSEVVDVGFDTSLSNTEERDALERFLVQVVLPYAFDVRATIVLHLVGARSFNAGTAVAVFDFDAELDDELATPNGVRTEAAESLTTALEEALEAEPETASDPLGFLRRVSDTKSQWPDAHVVGAYLGDGAQSTANCDLGLSSIADEASMQATAAACTGRHELALRDVDVWLLGTALTIDGSGMDQTQALDTVDFLTYVIEELGHGTVTCQSVAPLPGACP